MFLGMTRRSRPGRLLALLALAFAAAAGPSAASDATRGAPALYDPGPLRHPGVTRRSLHIPMPDGVRIAVDLTLPEALAPDARLPAIVRQTRYWRSAELRWPFSHWLDRPHPQVEAFARRGYAWVDVDARGSGASFGSRAHEWTADEIADGAEVVDWIVAQPWSDGRVGTFGTSYDGTTAEFLVVNRHPAVVAAAPRFSLFDVYTDIAYPGGVPLDWFTRTWGALNASLDQNRVPAHFLKEIGFFARLLRGVRPVDGPDGRALLAAAVRDHAANYDVHAAAQRVVFRDDRDFSGVGVEAFSPATYAAAVDASGAAIYSWSGWFDGGYAGAAIKRHLTLGGSRNRLILGPWDHGGAHQVVDGHSLPTDFDHDAELLKFFDRWLRDADTGLEGDAPVHYFTMVEDRWKAAPSWPPPARATPVYFAASGRLASEPPREAGEDAYTVDPTHGTGDASRWNSLMGLPVTYPERSAEDAKLLVYQTGPLAVDLEVTGHPLATLFVASSAEDGAFFVYLEDVAPDGRVEYVTEGVLRALHRRLSRARPAWVQPVPWRSYLRADAWPLVPGEVAELRFELQPTSWLFRAGHAIRIALAGADADHFAPIPAGGPPPTWRVQRSRAHPSHVVLPVVARE